MLDHLNAISGMFKLQSAEKIQMLSLQMCHSLSIPPIHKYEQICD